MSDRCTVHRIDLRDAARSASDPALAMLVSGGWRVVAHLALAEDDGAPYLLLILAPPLAVPAVVQPIVPVWAWPAAVGLVACVVGFLALSVAIR
ncbi:MAG: hypothetical protein KGS10_05665 [Chloroflexi bacterium]|nr:hypothetical protein [Chloroflexota bacterium]